MPTCRSPLNVSWCGSGARSLVACRGPTTQQDRYVGPTSALPLTKSGNAAAGREQFHRRSRARCLADSLSYPAGILNHRAAGSSSSRSIPIYSPRRQRPQQSSRRRRSAVGTRNFLDLPSGGFREGPGLAMASLSLVCRTKSSSLVLIKMSK